MVVAPTKTTKKRALQAYQDELVAHSDLPVHNTFAPLRIVKNNSHTARIRSVREIPQHKPTTFSAQPRRASLYPKRVNNPAVAIYEAHKALRNKKQRRNRYRAQPAPANTRQVYIPRESGTNPQTQSVSIKSRLTYHPKDPRAPNSRPSQPKPPQKAQEYVSPRPRSQEGLGSGQAYFSQKGKSTHQPASETGKVSVFARLGARGSPPPPKTGGMTIIAPYPSSKKRRVVQKEKEPEEHFTVYMIDDSDDLPENPKAIFTIAGTNEEVWVEDDPSEPSGTVYAVGNDEEEGGESSGTGGANEPLANIIARKRDKGPEKPDPKTKGVTINASGAGGTSSPQQSMPKTPSSFDADYYVELQRQMEARDREMQILKSQIEKNDELFKDLRLFLLSQGHTGNA